MKKLFSSEARLTQGFGARPEYYSQFGLKGHEGADYVPTGSDWSVLCLEDGVVVKDDDIAGDKRTDAYGKSVTVWHKAKRKATQYCHLADNFVSLGQELKKGEKLGIMGSTGNTDGAHVHLNVFDVDENGIRLNRNNGYSGGIDPVPFLQEAAPPDSAGNTQPVAQWTPQTKIPLLTKTDLEEYGYVQLDDLQSKLKAKDTALVSFAKDVEKYKEDFDKYKEEHSRPKTALGGVLYDLAFKVG